MRRCPDRLLGSPSRSHHPFHIVIVNEDRNASFLRPLTGPYPQLGSAPHFRAQIAQLVEQWTENPRVPGSIPGLGT